MKELLFAFLIFLHLSSLAQNVSELDIKGGFKGFKIGASLQSVLNTYSSDMKLLDTETDAEGNTIRHVYKYETLLPLTAFGYHVAFLQLDFKKSKLSTIWIHLTDVLGERYTYEGDFREIYKNIKEAFGKHTKERKVLSEEYIWKGNKIQLTLHGNKRDEGFFIHITLERAEKTTVDF